MKFVIGIGNPEKKYDGTRHNIGFRAVDTLAKKLGKIPDVLFVKPGTYVNRTGEEAARLREKHDAAAADFLFVSDDVNLVFGKLRFRAGGSSGGHHGLESVIEAFGSGDFARLRIGVGGENLPKDLAPYVLEKFTKREEEELPTILEKASEICESWIRGGPDAALNCLSRLQSTQKGSEE